MNNILKAAAFAAQAHGNQKRKYTGDPYITHCFEVAQTVQAVGGTCEQIVAAILHDTVEDTDVTIGEIEKNFGMVVATYVEWLTDCEGSMGNRATRKEIDRERLAQAPAEVQTIKLADLLSNTKSIVERDPKFAVLYLSEKRELLKVLTKGDAQLHKRASEYCA